MNRADALREVSRYHDGTKHHFHRFARSFGYLDWASQPHPFRSFHGARQIALSPQPGADRTDIGHLLRFALGLSAWKRGRDARWSLRVNPSSGNLHPTEAFVVTGPVTAVSEASGVYHYATDRHCLEERCVFDAGAWSDATTASVVALVALTSIHWREAWKYGERAFRYCQHDLGHAIASIRIAAALVGLRGSIAPEWSHREIARLTGIDRDEDYVEAEREEPGCLLVLFRGDRTPAVNRIGLLDATSRGAWSGRASQLSEDHVQWTFIDDVARATEEIGAARGVAGSTSSRQGASRVVDANLILRRRSALALDGRSTIDADDFLGMLSGVMPSNAPPWDALWWEARVHLVLFVHRVNGLPPGIYVLPRTSAAGDRLRIAIGKQFSWDGVSEQAPLVRLMTGDCRRLSDRLSCDQEIAGDGFFSLGMLAEFDRSLDEFGPAFYRHLFWECGVVGQQLYLEAEAAGARGTGIGCFYDDPVHDVLGLTGHAFQSLYHFTIGKPVEDPRLTSEPGYEWEH